MKFFTIALLSSISTVMAIDCFCVSTDDDAAAGRQPQRKFNLSGRCEELGGKPDVESRTCELLPDAAAFTEADCSIDSGDRVLVPNCFASVL
ncbi:hypothetical protein FVEG_16834 [Fusarium verticillioides 7600]|uniref:Uncharacterized protein n=1 Tax=Gibberella moniliformis (strain M3125 / FGSC 7600) TaxID=334819 RepID=W7MVF7_GIBM7|nr:hypothetical protein FVEG_16834 [Fusarium verticillioides 7600]EWG51675.1 hypothetical protein FVEG_16834 [Fusarium verticillioides 7600]